MGQTRKEEGDERLGIHFVWSNDSINENQHSLTIYVYIYIYSRRGLSEEVGLWDSTLPVKGRNAISNPAAQ